jgi:hypothetical protein
MSNLGRWTREGSLLIALYGDGNSKRSPSALAGMSYNWIRARIHPQPVLPKSQARSPFPLQLESRVKHFCGPVFISTTTIIDVTLSL